MPISKANLNQNFNKIKKCIFIVALIFIIIWLFSNKYINNHKHDLLTSTIDLTNSNNIAIKSTEQTLIQDQDQDQDIDSEQDLNEITIYDDISVNKLNTNNTTQTTSEDSQVNITIKKNDNLEKLFSQYKLSKNDLYTLLSNSEIKKYLANIKPKQRLEIYYQNPKKIKSDYSISKIYFYPDKFNIIKISKKNNNFIAEKSKLDLEEVVEYAQFSISSSMFEDAFKNNIPSKLIYQLIEIFTWDIDFGQDLRKNDRIEFLYRTYHYNDKKPEKNHRPYAIGPILAVKFHNNNKLYTAIRYEDHNGKLIDYYNTEGLSLRKSFIRSPVKFTRISSKFTLGRNHPILHRIRAHKGVDYAAPTGTPIKAAGDGKIIHYGRKGGYGKAAILQHGSKYTTLYAHMSNYNKKLKTGSYVKQGQTIGYVGQTGLATGPHLHYEFRINDRHVNPLTVKLPKAKAIAKNNLTDFAAIKNNFIAKIDYYNKYYNLDNISGDILIAKK